MGDTRGIVMQSSRIRLFLTLEPALRCVQVNEEEPMQWIRSPHAEFPAYQTEAEGNAAVEERRA